MTSGAAVEKGNPRSGRDVANDITGGPSAAVDDSVWFGPIMGPGSTEQALPLQVHSTQGAVRPARARVMTNTTCIRPVVPVM